MSIKLFNIMCMALSGVLSAVFGIITVMILVAQGSYVAYLKMFYH